MAFRRFDDKSIPEEMIAQVSVLIPNDMII